MTENPTALMKILFRGSGGLQVCSFCTKYAIFIVEGTFLLYLRNVERQKNMVAIRHDKMRYELVILLLKVRDAMRKSKP